MYMHQKLSWFLRMRSRGSNLNADWKKIDEHTTHTIIRFNCWEVENALKVNRSPCSSYTPSSNLVLLQWILTMKMVTNWMGDTHKKMKLVVDWWEKALKGSICSLGWKKAFVKSNEGNRCCTKIWGCVKFLGFFKKLFSALNGWQSSRWKKMNVEQITDLGISYMTQPTYR